MAATTRQLSPAPDAAPARAPWHSRPSRQATPPQRAILAAQCTLGNRATAAAIESLRSAGRPLSHAAASGAWVGAYAHTAGRPEILPFLAELAAGMEERSEQRLQQGTGNHAASELIHTLRLSRAPTAVLQRCGSRPCPASGCHPDAEGVDRESPLDEPGTAVRPALARTAVHGGIGAVRSLGYAPPLVDSVLRSGGQPLDALSRTTMESRFGHDFSAVRLHTGGQAARSARAVGATAYTVASHIVIGEGFVPSSAAGQRLLAHELAHVVQQEHATLDIQGATPVVDATDPLEREADAVADRVAVGGSVEVAGRSTGHVVHRQPAAGGPASLESRLAAYQQLVKNAGKLRMAENSRALEQWRQFLQQQVTPAEVQSQVHAEEVRSLLDMASRRGLAETALVEQWLGTPGPNSRWVVEQKIRGLFHACTGCHAALQADILDRGLLERRGQLRTPLAQLATGPGPESRPSFAPGEQTAVTVQPGAFPRVAEAQARINAIRPYLRELGPERFQVLPPETLGSTATPAELMADINGRISRRLADYQEFSRRIDAPNFDYLQLRPIVRELLPLADPDVRRAVRDAISTAETWETIESIVVGAATVGLLLLVIFPPTSAIGVVGALALGAAVSARQVYRGLEEYEQGRLYSLARGTPGVLDPGQIQAADSLMAVGALNIVLGSIGVAASAVGAVRLIRAPAPPGGVGALNAVEGEAGGDVIRVTGWRTQDPRVTVTGPNGRVISEGPLSSFRPGATAGPRPAPSAAARPGYVYPTEGGAARVAQPVPKPAPDVAARPVAVPGPPAAPLPPDVQALLATIATTSGLGILATLGGPQVQPVMPAGLTRAQQELWRTCNQQHDIYKATQDEAAAYAAKMDPLRKRLMQNQTSLQDRIDFCTFLDERIKLVQRLHRERLRYMRLNCDQFDWFGAGTTQAERIAAHQAELDNISAQLRNFYDLRKRFCL